MITNGAITVTAQHFLKYSSQKDVLITATTNTRQPHSSPHVTYIFLLTRDVIVVEQHELFGGERLHVQLVHQCHVELRAGDVRRVAEETVAHLLHVTQLLLVVVGALLHADRQTTRQIEL